MEPVITGKYIQHQENNGHEGITVKDKGLVIAKDNPVLAASVDGEVSEVTSKESFFDPTYWEALKKKLLGRKSFLKEFLSY